MIVDIGGGTALARLPRNRIPYIFQCSVEQVGKILERRFENDESKNDDE